MASSHSAYGYTRINLKSEKNGLLEVGRGKALQNFNRESNPERHQAGACYHLPGTTISRIFYSLDYIGIDTTPYDTNTQPMHDQGFFLGCATVAVKCTLERVHLFHEKS